MQALCETTVMAINVEGMRGKCKRGAIPSSNRLRTEEEI